MIITGRRQNQSAQLLLAVAIALLSPAAVVLAQSAPTPRLLDRTPFDRVTLSAQAGGQVLEVHPIPFPNRVAPTQFPGGMLKIQLADGENAGVDYEVNWSDVAKVELFPDLLLLESQRLIAGDQFDEAFAYLREIRKTYPQTVGLSEATSRFLQADAGAAFRSGQYDRALAALGSLYDMDPAASGLSGAVDAVAGRIIEQLVKDGDLRAARQSLEIVGRTFPKLRLQVVDKWEMRFQQDAAKLIAIARERLAADDYTGARGAIADAIAVWPTAVGAQELSNEIRAKHPVLVVGVFEAAPSNLADRIDNWPARRTAELVVPRLVRLDSYSLEGAKYVSPLAEIAVDPTGQRVDLDFSKAEGSGTGTQPAIDAGKVAAIILNAAQPTSSVYRPDLATLIASVELLPPAKVAISLSRPHPQPEAALQIPLGNDLRPTSGAGGYSALSNEAGVTRYSLARAAANGPPIEVHEIVQADEEAALLSLVRGEIDLLDRVPPWKVKQLRASAQVKVIPYRLPVVHALLPVGTNPLLSRREFRRALCYAINRERLVRESLSADLTPVFQPVSGPFTAGQSLSDPVRYAYNSQVSPRDYDPRLASLLFSVSWSTIQKQRGVAEPKAELPTLRLGHGSDPVVRLACESIVSELAKAGLKVDLVELSTDQQIDPATEVDLRFVELMLWEPVVDAGRLLGPAGVAGGASDFMATILSRADSAANLPDLQRVLHEVHEVASSDLPVIPLWQVQCYMAVGAGISGVSDQPMTPYEHIERWRLTRSGEVRP